jgi:hypothetical protein
LPDVSTVVMYVTMFNMLRRASEKFTRMHLTVCPCFSGALSLCHTGGVQSLCVFHCLSQLFVLQSSGCFSPVSVVARRLLRMLPPLSVMVLYVIVFACIALSMLISSPRRAVMIM